MYSRLFGIEATCYVLFGNSMYISTRREEALFFTQRLLQLSLRYICLPISSSGRPFISFPALHQQDPPITSTVIICLFVSSQRRPVIPPTHSIPLSTTQVLVRPHTHPVEYCPNLIFETCTVTVVACRHLSARLFPMMHSNWVILGIQLFRISVLFVISMQ